MIGLHSYMQKVSLKDVKPGEKYLLHLKSGIDPQDEEQLEDFYLQSMFIVNSLNEANPALAKRVTVSRKNFSITVAGVDAAEINLVDDIIFNSKYHPSLFSVSKDECDIYFFNLDPDRVREDADKLALIKAIHSAAKVDDVLGDYFFENISRVLEDKYLFEDDQDWKLQCRSKFAKWLVGKSVKIQHHDSLQEDVLIDVKVVNSDEDRIVVFVESSSMFDNPLEVAEIERVPVSLEALDNVQELVQAYEIETQKPMIHDAPKTTFEEQILVKFGV